MIVFCSHSKLLLVRTIGTKLLQVRRTQESAFPTAISYPHVSNRFMVLLCPKDMKAWEQVNLLLIISSAPFMKIISTHCLTYGLVYARGEQAIPPCDPLTNCTYLWFHLAASRQMMVGPRSLWKLLSLLLYGYWLQECHNPLGSTR